MVDHNETVFQVSLATNNRWMVLALDNSAKFLVTMSDEECEDGDVIVVEKTSDAAVATIMTHGGVAFQSVGEMTILEAKKKFDFFTKTDTIASLLSLILDDIEGEEDELYITVTLPDIEDMLQSLSEEPDLFQAVYQNVAKYFIEIKYDNVRDMMQRCADINFTNTKQLLDTLLSAK